MPNLNPVIKQFATAGKNARGAGQERQEVVQVDQGIRRPAADMKEVLDTLNGYDR